MRAPRNFHRLQNILSTQQCNEDHSGINQQLFVSAYLLVEMEESEVAAVSRQRLELDVRGRAHLIIARYWGRLLGP